MIGVPATTAVTKSRIRQVAIVAGVVVVGGMYALVAPIDGGLGRVTGSLPAALVDFTGGALVLSMMLLWVGQLRAVTGVRRAPRHLLLGGVCGAFLVTAAIVTVGTLGAGGVAAATITGQLVAALGIDRFAFFGLDPTPVSLRRGAGAVLLLAGTFLIVLA